MSEAAEYTIRFRHTLGDIGPFQFESTSSVQSVKEELFSRWPAGRPSHPVLHTPLDSSSAQRSVWPIHASDTKHVGAVGFSMVDRHGFLLCLCRGPFIQGEPNVSSRPEDPVLWAVSGQC
jgi:hypothetical protein